LQADQFTSPLLFDRRALVRLLVPLVIEQFLLITVGMADTVMVARAGEAAVSGVSLVDSINFLLIMIFAALATGGTVVVSQYLGRKDLENGSRAAKQLLHSTTLMALLLMTLSLLFRKQILNFLYVSLEPDVMSNAMDYFLYTALAYPFIAIYNAGAALFRAMGNSKISMYCSLVVNAVNIVVNAVLIFGFDMAAAGAGIGTLVSRIVAAAIMLVLMRRPNDQVYIRNMLKLEWAPDLLKRILKVGIPNGMENGMFQIGKLLVAGLCASLGTAAVSANAIAGSVGSVAQVPGVSIGLALITVVGQCMGARQPEQAVYYTKRLMLLTFSTVGVLSAALFFLAPPLVSLFNLSAAASVSAVELLRWFAVFNTFIYPLSFVLPNALRGAGDSRFSMLVSLFSMWSFRIGLSYLFCNGLDMGVLGIWLAMFVDWVVRSIIFTVRFLRGKWKELRVI